MSESVKAGTTSYITEIKFRHAATTPGTALTGIDNTKVAMSYKRNTAAAAVDITLDASSGVTLGTYKPTDASHGAVKLIDDTKHAGVCELHVPDNAIAVGADSVVISWRDAGSNDVLSDSLKILLPSVIASDIATTAPTVGTNDLAGAIDRMNKLLTVTP